MTMQVAMVGTDGILLASDLMWAENNLPIRASQLSPKIKLSARCDVAVSFARSMETAGLVADAILALEDSDWDDPITTLMAAARGVVEQPTIGRKEIQCLIVSAKPTVAAYFLRVSNMGGCWTPYCQNVIGYACAGDDTNPAVFWVKRYYEHRPVEALLPLAAQLVVSASEVNSAGIGGLEIVTCVAGSIKRLPSDSIDALESEAQKRSRAIGELVLGSHPRTARAPS